MRGRTYLLALMAAMPAAQADPVYVIEQLVVNVMTAPDAAERVATVKSGDRLELLDRQGEQSHVKLANGAEGWIKSSYLSAEPTLTARLNERTVEVGKLKQDVAKLQSDLTAARAAASVTQQATTAHGKLRGTPSVANVQPPAPPEVTSAAPAPVEHDPSPLLSSAPTTAASPWEWVLSTCAITLPVGFTLGWQVLARRIRRKFGGLRIY